MESTSCTPSKARCFAVSALTWSEYLTYQLHDRVIDVSGRLSVKQLRVWESLHTVTERLRRETGRVLVSEAGLSQPEFTVLARLSLSADGERSALCAQAIGWDSSRLSHQLSRLEKRGFVSRSGSDVSDRRASVVTLTDAGRAAYRRALGPHLRAAHRAFGEALTDAQVDALSDALAAIARHLDENSADTDRAAGRNEEQ